MPCSEANCINLSCALCYDCQQSLCLNHIIVHHNNLIGRHISFYEVLQQLYEKLHSMSIEQCYQQAFEQLSSTNNYFIDKLRSVREELIEQLNSFKQKQFSRLQKISNRLHDTELIINNTEANDIKMNLEKIQLSIDSLVYGIHLEVTEATNDMECRKIFYHKVNSLSLDVRNVSTLEKSSSWTNGLTENYWKKTNEFDDRLSLF